MRGEKGFALVLTLVVTALMVAVTAELIHQVYVDTTISRGFRDGQQASLLAESGITGGKKLLQLSMPSGYSSLSDKWAAPFKLEDEIGTIEISVSEESGKICLNDLVNSSGEFDKTTTHDALVRLGKRLEIPEELWNALADWLDGNDGQRSGGAESGYYMTLKPPYRTRNGKLATLAELTMVKGFTPEIVSRLAPFVTVYSEAAGSTIGKAKVNINTAPKEVIVALDDSIDDQVAERILEKRSLSPFKNLGELANVSGAGTLTQLSNLDIKGQVYRITSVAKVKDAARKVEAVVPFNSETVLSWQEY